MPIVAVLMFLTWRNYRKIEDFTPVESVLLVLEIPRTNDKQELAAEQLFASLHGILRDNKELRLSGGHQEHIIEGQAFAQNFGHRALLRTKTLREVAHTGGRKCEI